MVDYIQRYEKKSKQITIMYWGVAISTHLIALLFIYNTHLTGNHVNVIYTLLGTLLIVLRYVKIDMKLMRKNVSRINDIYRNELNVELALDIFRELLKKRKRRDYAVILLNYMVLLLDVGKIDEFKKVYMDNQEKIRKFPFDKSLQEKLIYMSDDREAYRKHIFAYRFSKYRNKIGKLSMDKTLLRRKDRLYEIMQLYELKEYKKAIEVIDKFQFDSPYEQLLFQSYRERCLYHLKESCIAPDESIYPFVFITEWSSLVKMGEEFKYENMNQMIKVIEHDQSIAKKKINFLRIICALGLGFGFVLMILFMLVDCLNEKIQEIQFGVVLRSEEYRIEETYGLYDEDDISAAVFFGTKENEGENAEIHPYISMIQFSNVDGEVMTKVDIQQLTYDSGTKIYTTSGVNDTYVVILTEKRTSIVYDGKKMRDIKLERLPKAADFDEPYAYFFVLNGKFDKDLLKINGKVDFVYEKEDSWPMKLTVKNADEWGVNLTCSYKGDGEISDIHTRARYWLEEKTTEGWKKIDVYEDEGMWKTHIRYFDKNPVQDLEIYWGNVYGEIPAGEYRIGKDFTWYDEKQMIEITQSFYAEFEVK